jgi:diacylglycerol kinase
MSKRHSTVDSFGYAVDGFKEALRNEPNIRVHLVIAVAVIALAYFLQVSQTEWVILLFTVAFVLILELVNTTLEAIVDIVSPRRHPKAKLAKDVAAAAVFISALLALVIGGLIFIPRLWPLFDK